MIQARLRNLSVAAKIWLSMGFLILGYLLSICVTVFTGASTANKIERTEKTMLPAQQLAAQAAQSLLEQVVCYENAAITGEADLLGEADAFTRELYRDLDLLRSMTALPEGHRHVLDDVIPRYRAYTAEAGPAYHDLVQAGDEASPQLEQKTIELSDRALALRTDLQDLRDGITASLHEDLNATIRQSNQQRFLHIGLFCIVLLTTLFLVSLTINNFTLKPLRHLLQVMSTGDRVTTDNFSKDEIGDLARRFQSMFDEQADMMRRLQEEVDAKEDAQRALTKHQEQLEELVARRTSEVIRINAELEAGRADLEVQVRIQQCLMAVTEVLSERSQSQAAALAAAAERIPQALRFRELAGACIRLEDESFPSRGFVDSIWSLTAKLEAGERVNGSITINYRQAPPVGPADVFLQQEGDLLYALADLVGEMVSHRQAEETIHKLSSALEQSPRAVIITAPDGCIEYVNPRYTELTGRPAEHAIGLHAELLGREHLDSEEGRELSVALAEGHAWQGEIQAEGPDGRVRHHSVAVSPIRDAEGKTSCILITREDVSERKELESQLLQAQKLESVGQLAAGIAHELNTPAQFVGDNLRFLRESLGDLLGLVDEQAKLLNEADAQTKVTDLTPKLDELREEADLEYLTEEIPTALDQSTEGIDRVTKIVRAMKEFSHPGSTDMTAANLNEAIKTTIIIAQNEWKYVADVETELDPELPQVPCLVSEFNQVVLNLIVNARDAIQDAMGDDHEKGLIRITTSHDEEWCEVCVSDTGAGMPDDIKKRIFEPFFTTKEVGRGSGQGLAIARNVIVTKHSGELTVKSEPGVGTTFRIRIPLEAA